MKIRFLSFSILIAGMMFFLPGLKAQVQFGVHGSRIISERGEWGGGAFLKGFLGDNVAIGASVKVYPKHFATQTISIAGNNYRKSEGDLFVPVTGSLDVFLSNGFFRPYIGSDVGLYYNKYFFRLDNDTNGENVFEYDQSKSYFGVGPRFGFAIQSGIIGVFAQFQYNYLFGSKNRGEDLIVPGINANITTNPVRTFASIDAGIYFRIGENSK